jgi:hypothetical protein
MQRKPSFAFLFTATCLSITVLSILILSTVSLVRLRRLSYAQIEGATKENIANMSSQAEALINTHVSRLEYTSISAIPFMRETTVDVEALHNYFGEMHATSDNILGIFCTNNLRWNSPGGYYATSINWTPGTDWNNLERSWYQDAKKAQGKLAFTLFRSL